MTRFMKTLMIGAALMGVATAASATTMTTALQSFSFNTPATTDFNNPVSFQLFDTTLGTLDSITISGAYGIGSTVTVMNNASGASSGNVAAQGDVQFASTNAAIQAVLNSLIDTYGAVTTGAGASTVTHLSSAAFELLGGSVGYSLDPGTSVQVTSNNSGNVRNNTTGNIVDTNASDFTPFEASGGGTGNLSANTFTTTSLSNTGGNTTATQVTTGTAGFTIFYTYDTPPPSSVPEPASMALLGAGLLGAGLVRRRNK